MLSRFFYFMAKPRQPKNQLMQIPEYGEIQRRMQEEAASIITDYIRQYVGIASSVPEPGSGIFMNFDRVLNTQSYKELVWYDLYAEVGRDPHVMSVMQSAKLNIAGMKYDVSPYLNDGEKEPSKRNKEIAAFVKDVLKKTGYFPQHLYNLMDAIGNGFSVSEIMWEPTSDGVYIREILNRTQRRIQFDAVSRTPKIRNLSNPYLGDPLPDKKFIIHRVNATWDNPFGDALYQSIYWMWLFKRMASKFWLTNLETATAPIPIVKHPASATTALKNEALAVAEQIRVGAFGRIPNNMELMWAEASNMMAANVSYGDFIRFCNDEISKCINGQTLTSEAGSDSGKGTQALGNVHQQTQSNRDIFRAEGLSSTLNATLIKWIVDFNFNDVDGYPEFRFDLEQEENLSQEATIIKTLSDAGYEFDVKELSDKFNYKIIKKEMKPLPKGEPIKPDLENK